MRKRMKAQEKLAALLPKPNLALYKNPNEIFFLSTDWFKGYYPNNMADARNASSWLKIQHIYQWNLAEQRWQMIPALPSDKGDAAKTGNKKKKVGKRRGLKQRGLISKRMA